MRLLGYVDMNYGNWKYDWKHMRLLSYVNINYGNCKILLKAYEAAELFKYELWQL